MANFRKTAPPGPRPNSQEHPLHEVNLARRAAQGLEAVLAAGHRPPLHKDAVLPLLATLPFNEEALTHMLATRTYVRNIVWQYFREFAPPPDWRYVAWQAPEGKSLGPAWLDDAERYHLDLLFISRLLPKRATTRGEARVERLIALGKDALGTDLRSVRVCLFNEPANAFEVEL